MSVLSELEKRLAENEERIDALIQHLEEHAELEDSLRSAGGGLKEANAEVRRLAESAKVANESLAAILTSFRDAVEILRKSDPARATEAVTGVTERLTSAEHKIIETIDEAASAISSEQEQAGQQFMAEALAIRKSIPTIVAYITLALVLVIFGFEILSYFPTLLSG